MNKFSLKFDLIFKVALGFLGATALFFFLFNSAAFFYQQDEYYHFWFLNRISLIDIFTKSEGVHYYPLTILLKKIQYVLFGISLYPRIIITFLFHLTAIFSLAVLLKKLNLYHRIYSPLLILLFIGVNQLNSQAYLWLSTYDNTMPCIILFLWSLVFFLKHEETKQPKFFWLSLVFLVISLLFKEYSLVGFILFFGMILKRNGFSLPTSLKKEKLYLLALSGMALLLFGLRFLISPIEKELSSGAILANKFNLIKITELLYNYVQIAIKAPWQIVVPYGLYGKFLLLTGLPAGIDIASILDVANQLQFFLGFLTFFVLLVFYCRSKANEGMIKFAGFFYVLSLVPFTILTPFQVTTYLDGKYYYFIAVALIVLFSTVLKDTKEGIWKKYFFPVVAVLLIISQGYYYVEYLTQLKDVGSLRQRLTNQIVEAIDVKQTGKNLIIYVASSSNGYYGRPDTPLPFQVGVGNILAVHLYDKHKFITQDYFKNPDTVKLTPQLHAEADKKLAQGVFTFADKSFGFFYDYNDLKDYAEANPNAIDNIWSFYWWAEKNQLTQTTQKTRARLKTESTAVNFDKKMILEHDIQILGSKKYFAVNFEKKYNQYTSLDNKQITVHLDGQEISYGGPYLAFSFKGDGGKEYTFPKSYEGYDLGFCLGVRVGGQIVDNEIFFDGNKFKIVFAKPVEKGKEIGIAFALNAKILVYAVNQPLKYVLEAKNISIKGDGSQRYKIKLSSLVKSLRSVYLNDIDRYQPHGLIDGKLTRLKGWGGYNTETLEVELFEPLKKGQILTIPILATSDLSDQDKIIFKYIL